jgi:hypothetical protein
LLKKVLSIFARIHRTEALLGEDLLGPCAAFPITIAALLVGVGEQHHPLRDLHLGMC